MLLVQEGFQALCGTGGAGTWRREWSKQLFGLDVVIAFDNDDAGRLGAKTIAENLKRYANRIRVVKWPGFVEQKGDVTDFFVKHNKSRDDFLALIDNASEIEHDLKTIDGIRFVQPGQFLVSDDHIQYIEVHKFEEVLIKILHSGLFITGRAIDVDLGTEELELTFHRDGEQKRIWVSRKVIADARKIIELSEVGLMINSSNSKRIVEYLTAFEACNTQFIPKRFIAHSLGWKITKGKFSFLLGNKKNDTGIEFRAEAGFERFARALKPQGSFDKWRAAIKPVLEYPIAAFGLYASFAAPLLKPLGAPNFLIDFYGATSLGKTTELEICSSVWGNPHKEAGGLVFSWDSTKVYLERIANFFCDLPIFPDDSQTVDDRTLRNTLYQIANGTGRGRGAVAGIRHTSTWHTVCFSTGEKSLTECTTFGGARARTIGIYGSPFPDAGGEFINEVKTLIRENYGHAGQRFTTELAKLLESEKEVENIKQIYSDCQKSLSKDAGTEVGDRYSHYFATVKVAAGLACRFLEISDPVEADNIVYKVFENLISDEMKEVDLCTRAMVFTVSWSFSNTNYFARPNASRDEGEIYGLWKENEFIGISPHKFAEVLERQNFSVKVVRKGWAERGWIETDRGDHTVVKRMDARKTSRFITIPWHVVSKFNGN